LSKSEALKVTNELEIMDVLANGLETLTDEIVDDEVPYLTIAKDMLLWLETHGYKVVKISDG